jgi:hypothetical protein
MFLLLISQYSLYLEFVVVPDRIFWSEWHQKPNGVMKLNCYQYCMLMRYVQMSNKNADLRYFQCHSPRAPLLVARDTPGCWSSPPPVLALLWRLTNLCGRKGDVRLCTDFRATWACFVQVIDNRDGFFTPRLILKVWFFCCISICIGFANAGHGTNKAKGFGDTERIKREVWFFYGNSVFFLRFPRFIQSNRISGSVSVTPSIGLSSLHSVTFTHSVPLYRKMWILGRTCIFHITGYRFVSSLCHW